MSRILTGVGAVFSAGHFDTQGRLHGHDYEVTAWFDLHGGQDAAFLQTLLQRCVARFDHQTLEQPWAEDVAEQILTELKAVEVEIRRPLLRLYAKVVA